MSQIFIANPTLTNRQLHIRIDQGGGDKSKVQIVDIRAGGQVFFPGDLDAGNLASVVKQLEKAGGVPASDIKSIRNRFSLLYTISDSKKAIPGDKINQGLQRDEEVRQELAGQALDKGTVAAFNVGEQVGGREVTLEIVEVNDQGRVEGGADFEIGVSKKPGKTTGGRSGKRTERKR